MAVKVEEGGSAKLRDYVPVIGCYGCEPKYLGSEPNTI